MYDFVMHMENMINLFQFQSTCSNQLVPQGEWGRMFKEVPRHTPHSVPTISVPELMNRYNFPRLDLAKIDIEGAESEVFQPEADLSWCVVAFQPTSYVLVCTTAQTGWSLLILW